MVSRGGVSIVGWVVWSSFRLNDDVSGAQNWPTVSRIAVKLLADRFAVVVVRANPLRKWGTLILVRFWVSTGKRFFYARLFG